MDKLPIQQLHEQVFLKSSSLKPGADTLHVSGSVEKRLPCVWRLGFNSQPGGPNDFKDGTKLSCLAFTIRRLDPGNMVSLPVVDCKAVTWLSSVAALYLLHDMSEITLKVT